MTRTRIAIAFAGALLAALVAAPATATALPTTTQVLANIADGSEIEWHTMTPVAEFVAKQNAISAQNAKASKPKTARTPRSSVPVVTDSSAERWSTAQLDAVAREALAAFGVPAEEWEWVLAANRAVAFRESGNRPGAISATGKYQGLHQWSPSWAGAERLDGNWSVKRFVEVYAVGGKAKIRQHWRATIGSL